MIKATHAPRLSSPWRARALALGLSVAAVVPAGCSSDEAGPKLEGKAAMQAAEIARLERDIYKVDKSIRVTKTLINRSKGERYLPDLYFRQAELLIEKARLKYFLILEEAGLEDKAAVTAPEARLLKDQAVSIYRRILSEFPDYPDNDKIRFFIAHEFRELGKFDDMIKTYKELISRHEKSPFRYEAWLILGDHYFDKGEIDNAMSNYQAILNNPETYAHNMARYKLGWCWINKDKPKKAVALWEKAVKTPTPLEPGEKRGPDDEPRLAVRREALKDLAFYYAEARNPANAVEYFDELAKTRSEYELALTRLAKRFQIKTMYKRSADVYRELIKVSSDLERQIEWAQNVYNAVVAAKTLKSADRDVVMLSEISARYKHNWRATENERLIVKDFELLARDLSTRLQTLAKERKQQKLFDRSAQAYEAYLSVFDDSPARLDMEWNYAEALFAAGQHVRAGQQYEKVLALLEKDAPLPTPDTQPKEAKADDKPAAKDASATDVKEAGKDAKKADTKTANQAVKQRSAGQKGGDTKQAMYSAVVSYFEALKKEDRGTRFESMMAREGIKHLGGRFVQVFPDDPNTPTVKFNIARAYYEQGLFDDAIGFFTAFAEEYPAHKDAAAAAELALDSYAQKEDFEGLAKAARVFAANDRIANGSLKDRFTTMAEQAEQQQINRATIEAEGGQVVQALQSLISEKKGTEVAAKALHQAFVIARDRRNFEQMLEAGQPLLDEYGTTKYALEVLPSLAEQSLRISQVERAAQYYEEYARRYPQGESAMDFLEAAANIRLGLGEFDVAMSDYERLVNDGAPEKQAYYRARLAETAAQAGAWRRADQAIIPILEHPSHGVLAGAVGGEAALRNGDIDTAVERLSTAVELASAGEGLEDGSQWHGRAQYMIGEIARQQFESIQFGTDEDAVVLGGKFEVLAFLEGAYVGAIQVGDPEWAMGGLYRIATAYRETAEFLDNAPIPDGLSDEEQAAYKGALAERSGPLRQQAEDALQACRDQARSLQAFNRFVKACTAGVAVDDDADLLAPRPRGVAIPGRDKFEARLIDNPKDVGTLTELIRAAISVRDYHLAVVLADRALEINDDSAELLNLKGVALVGVNNDQAAALVFRAAIKQGKLDEARKNLATLYKAYGDTKRAETQLERMTGQPTKDLIPAGSI
jgi:tetratricopeptide (TPR) repeat protein